MRAVSAGGLTADGAAPSNGSSCASESALRQIVRFRFFLNQTSVLSTTDIIRRMYFVPLKLLPLIFKKVLIFL